MDVSTIREMLGKLTNGPSPENQEEYNDMMLTAQVSLLMAAIVIIERLDELLKK